MTDWHLTPHGGRKPRSPKPRTYGTAAHWLARLERDGHTALAAQVRRGALSAHAAALKVAYRRRSPRQDPKL
jgi:hypothetical protein